MTLHDNYKKYNGSCFMSLSEILSKLQTSKVTHFIMFSDGLLIYVILICGNLILSWPKLLQPFKAVFSPPYIDVYVFAM